MSLKIIVAGGGTGGHIFPAVAIANAIRKLKPGTEFLFVGAKGKMEMEKVPQAGYKIEGLDITGFNRSSLIKNIGLPLKLVKSFMQVRSIFKNFKPDAVIGVGGYSTFPVLRFAQSSGIPTFIHEANSFGGKSNKMLSKKANRVFVATDGMERFFPAHKITITGNPVRASIAHSVVTREEAIRFFQLDPSKKIILVVGGSLGAKSINEAIEAGLDTMIQNNLQLIWQTGKLYAEKAKQSAAGKKGVWVNDFITQMENAYAAADIIVSRAGAMSIAEICLAAKPAVFVPYPHAAEDHQTVNAMNLVTKNAALMVKDANAKNELVAEVTALATDEAKQKMLKENIKPLGVADADVMVAKEILKLMSQTF
jgi:UDP-N-acetylglucosamine--N-acetylmuramyl-(pentapeptide) pyrophosphoryl-undecaprenol N-acetylglucosamine transferase